MKSITTNILQNIKTNMERSIHKIYVPKLSKFAQKSNE